MELQKRCRRGDADAKKFGGHLFWWLVGGCLRHACAGACVFSRVFYARVTRDKRVRVGRKMEASSRRFVLLLLLSTLISIALPFHAPNLIRPNIPAPRATSIHLKGQPHVDWRSFRQQLIEAEQQQENEPSIPPTPAAPPPATPASPPQAYYGDDDWCTHDLANDERGCFLLAQPRTIFPEQPPSPRRCSCSNSADYGTIGVLLERPTNKTTEPPRAPARPALIPFASGL